MPTISAAWLNHKLNIHSYDVANEHFQSNFATFSQALEKDGDERHASPMYELAVQLPSLYVQNGGPTYEMQSARA